MEDVVERAEKEQDDKQPEVVVCKCHFDEALQHVTPSVTPQELEHYNALYKHFSSTTTSSQQQHHNNKK